MSRLPQMAEVNAPRLKEHAEENWPECVEIGPAPPSGVRFDGEEDWMESAANVGSVGAHASPLSDQPSFKLAAIAMASGALAQSLADLSDAGARALARCAVDEAPCSDVTTLFEVQGDDASPCRAFDDLPTSLMALTPKARGDDVEGTDGDADGDSREAAGEVAGAPQSPMLLRWKHIVAWQGRDSFCQKLRQYLDPARTLPVEVPNLALYMTINRECYQVEKDGLLVHMAISSSKRGVCLTQWVVPMALRALALRVAHDDVTSQHPSVSATHAKLAEHFYWRGMGEDVRNYVQSCLPWNRQSHSTPRFTSRR